MNKGCIVCQIYVLSLHIPPRLISLSRKHNFSFLKRPYFVCLFEYQSSIFSRSLFQKDVSLLEADLVKSADILNVEILKCKRLPMMRTTHDEIGRIVMTISWVIVTNKDNYDILFYLKIGQI